MKNEHMLSGTPFQALAANAASPGKSATARACSAVASACRAAAAWRAEALGALAVATVMSCTLSVDHRAVDGAIGAEYLGAFKRLIEDPLGMLL